MKTQISLAGVALSLLGSLISVSSAEAAGLFNNGDSISGSSGGTGLFNLSIDNDVIPGIPAPGPSLVYFGTTLAGPDGITIDGPDFDPFTYAEITNPLLAPTTTAESTIGFGATGGFGTLNNAQFRSFQAAVDPSNPPDFDAPTFVNDFIVMTNGAGLTVTVDIAGQIQSSAGVGGAVNFEIPVIVTGDDGVDTQVVDGVFRFSTQNIALADLSAVNGGTLDPSTNGELAYLLDVSSGGQSYSWQLDVVKDVPEPSSMVSLLALSALGAGMAMKRKVSK